WRRICRIASTCRGNFSIIRQDCEVLMEGIYVCLGALIIVAPLALLVIGIVQLHTLKSTVRSLARRVEELESPAAGFVASPKPVAEAMPKRAALPVAPPPLPPTIPAPVAPRI